MTTLTTHPYELQGTGMFISYWLLLICRITVYSNNVLLVHVMC